MVHSGKQKGGGSSSEFDPPSLQPHTCCFLNLLNGPRISGPEGKLQKTPPPASTLCPTSTDRNSSGLDAGNARTHGGENSPP